MLQVPADGLTDAGGEVYGGFESKLPGDFRGVDVFSVEVVMAIPGLKDLAAQGGATASLAFYDVSLEDLLQPERYSELVADLQNACANIPEGNAVRTMFSGELTKGTKSIGDLEITFILNGSQILP